MRGGAQTWRAAGLFADYTAGSWRKRRLGVLSTFPVVVPFLFVGEAALALRISNLLGVTTVFCCGLLLGRYAGGKPWQYGLVLSVGAVVLVGIIIALGG